MTSTWSSSLSPTSEPEKGPKRRSASHPPPPRNHSVARKFRCTHAGGTPVPENISHPTCAGPHNAVHVVPGKFATNPPPRLDIGSGSVRNRFDFGSKSVRNRFKFGSKSVRNRLFGSISVRFRFEIGSKSVVRFEIGSKSVRNRFEIGSKSVRNRFGIGCDFEPILN